MSATYYNDKTLTTVPVAVLQVDIDGSTVDETTDAGDTGDADYTVFPASEAAGDYAAFCSAGKFGRIVFDYANGTAGIGGTVTWKYLADDGTWKALAGVVDATAGFTTAAADGLAVTWDDPDPADWTEQTLNGVTGYWVAAEVATVYATNPVLDQVFVGGFDGHADRGRVAPGLVHPHPVREGSRYVVKHASMRVLTGAITSWRLVLWDPDSDAEICEVDSGTSTNTAVQNINVPRNGTGNSAEVRWLVTGATGSVRCVIDGEVE